VCVIATVFVRIVDSVVRKGVRIVFAQVDNDFDGFAALHLLGCTLIGCLLVVRSDSWKGCYVPGDRVCLGMIRQ
jgi:hypothetical protein